MKPRILIIRGGAIGDFVLTLPALRLVREAFAHCELTLLGYRHILSLAEQRYYADFARSIEYGPMSRFFIPNAELDPELEEFFGGFNQVVSYLFDPDQFFENNVRRCGVKHYLRADPRVREDRHAVEHLASPLERLALYLNDPAPQLFPNTHDAAEAAQKLDGLSGPLLSVHIGSGGARKNWPLERWTTLLQNAAELTPVPIILLIGGEADRERLAALKRPDHLQIRLLQDLPLPTLGAVLQRVRLHVGHDTGISHIAAAVGAKCLLLFGPTDPEVWAPKNPAVEVVRAPAGRDADFSMEGLELDKVWQRVLAGWG